jgi:hypothetical protein
MLTAQPHRCPDFEHESQRLKGGTRGETVYDYIV